MLFDLEREKNLHSLAADVCIVGAGPAGITIATELMKTGLDVCLAESGGLEDEPRTQCLYDGDSIGHPVRQTEGRHRVFGGSATKWGGRSAMMDPIDFEGRDWVQHSSWPISRDELLPYYERAKQAGNFSEPWPDDAQALDSIGKALPQFETLDIVPFVWRFAPPGASGIRRRGRPRGRRPGFDWGAVHWKVLRDAPNVNLVLHANLVGFGPVGEGESLRSARFKTLDGGTLDIAAKAFVLSCSGIENARILLNLNSKLPSRLTGSDNIGRYFAQHPRGTILTVQAGKAEALRLQRAMNKFAARDKRAVQYELGFALSEKAQRQHKLLNASATLCYSAAYVDAAKRLRDALYGRYWYSGCIGDIGRLSLDGFSMLATLWTKYVTGGQLLYPRGTIKVVADLEQQPSRDSRITLSSRCDELGVPRAVIDWRISELERTTARKFAEAVAIELQSLQLGKGMLEPWLISNEPIKEENLKGNYHLIGTTRMARTPQEGVVDENARVFGLSNLYVAGSSVFATGGHANPTLTITALAIRLADHLANEFAGRERP